jgi:hypothetical protein
MLQISYIFPLRFPVILTISRVMVECGHKLAIS